MEKINGTILEPALMSRRVIPSGMYTSVFRPGNRAASRAELGLPPEAWVVFHASARPTQNASKDLQTMRDAVTMYRELLGEGR
jgi:hypothetical protein